MFKKHLFYCLLKQNLVDAGNVMAICLMYLTDTESTVVLATNTSLTILLRLQTQLATGDIFTRAIDKIYCLCFKGIPEILNGEGSTSEQEKTVDGDTIQVSTLFSTARKIYIYFKMFFKQCSCSIKWVRRKDQVAFLSL